MNPVKEIITRKFGKLERNQSTFRYAFQDKKTIRYKLDELAISILGTESKRQISKGGLSPRNLMNRTVVQLLLLTRVTLKEEYETNTK